MTRDSWRATLFKQTNACHNVRGLTNLQAQGNTWVLQNVS